MAASTTSRSSFIKAPLATLCGCLFEPNQWPRWDRSIRTVELLETVKVGAQGTVFPVSGQPIPLKILKISGQKEIEISLSSRWLTRVYEYCLIEMPEGCVVTINLHCVGSLSGIGSRILRSRLTLDIERRLAQLKKYVEPTVPPPQ
jgi:hypothetical protein